MEVMNLREERKLLSVHTFCHHPEIQTYPNGLYLCYFIAQNFTHEGGGEMLHCIHFVFTLHFLLLDADANNKQTNKSTQSDAIELDWLIEV